MSLADLFASMEQNDEEMVKEAEEQEKIAAEEEAAGRIMARGFMDELNKLAQVPKIVDYKSTKVAPSAAALPTKRVGQAVPPKVAPGSVVQPGSRAGTKTVQQRQRKIYR